MAAGVAKNREKSQNWSPCSGDLRHEAASRFLEPGGTSRELQVLGGWSSLELVERYPKVNRERIRETLSRVVLPTGDLTVECTVSARAGKPDLRFVAK